MAGAFDLMSRHAQLRDDGSALVAEGGGAFWLTLANRPEPHPAGEGAPHRPVA